MVGDGDHPGLVRLLAVDLDERHGDCVDATTSGFACVCVDATSGFACVGATSTSGFTWYR
jgi:hypothetical protein